MPTAYEIKNESRALPLATKGAITLSVPPYWLAPFGVTQDQATGVAYVSAAGEATDGDANPTTPVSQDFFIAADGDDVDLSQIGTAFGSWKDASLGILTIYLPPVS